MTTTPYIVIPAYQPGPVLTDLVRDLLAQSPGQRIIVVDDGSSPDHAPVFRELAGLPGVDLLRHAVNLGKGQALKTAFNHFLLNAPADCPGVVTTDADGQHRVKDVLALVQALAQDPNTIQLGSRQFDATTPWRSRFGNVLTRFLFKVLVGRGLGDTQTGLRAVPRDFLPQLLTIAASGYDFELEMLVQAVRQKRPLEETPIDTVYIDGNVSSHFHPFFDSLRIYFVFFRFSALAVTTSLIDFLVFSIAFLICGSILGSIITARLVAGTFNFTFGKLLVFRSRDNPLPEALKYALTLGVMTTISYILITTLVQQLGMNVILSKALVETTLFLVSFAVLNTFVFKRFP